MSATIGINKSKFVIFGAGHDYTLADSGKGEKVFFSHPSVPLNSVNYVGQYFFLAPIYDDNDETVEPVMTDVVKDDISHCTFTPALNTVFDTEGEVEITVKYRREYIYPESTILVEKELTQTIEVVDHGSISTTFTYADLYSDNYLFVRPKNYSTVEAIRYYSLTSPYLHYTKVSSIPWRATALGAGSSYPFLSSDSLTDISELENADTSNCTEFMSLFYGCSALKDISALSAWDVSKVERMHGLFAYSGIEDIKALSSWNTASVTKLDWAFNNMQSLETLEGLENWDVSNCTDFSNLFNHCISLTDISALADWDVSNGTNMNALFSVCSNLESLEGLEKWDVSNVTTLMYAFQGCAKIPSLLPLSNWEPKPTDIREICSGCAKLKTLEGLERFDTSDCTVMTSAFMSCEKLLTLKGVETWDVSSATDMRYMFAYCYWVSDVSALADWEFGNADIRFLCSEVSALLDVDDITFDLTSCTNIGHMFDTRVFGSLVENGKDVYQYDYNFYADYDDNKYAILGYHLNQSTKDASNASNWQVTGTGLSAFDSLWSNRPAWN